MKFKKLLATLAVAAFGIGTASAAATSLSIFTGRNGALTAGLSSVRSTVTDMTETSPGVFTGTVVLGDVNGENYNFCFGEIGAFDNITYYGPEKDEFDNVSTPLNLAGGASITSEIVTTKSVSNICWVWETKTGVIELDATVDTNTMTATLTNKSAAQEPALPTPSYLGVQIGKYRSVSKMNSSNKVELKNVGQNIFTGEVVLTPETGYYFCLWNNDKPNGFVGPGTTQEVAINLQENQEYTGTITEGSGENGDCWYWAPQDGEAILDFTVNWNKQTISIVYKGAPVPEVPGETYTITVNFAAENFVLGEYIANYIDLINLHTEEAIPVNTNPITFEYSKIPSGINFAAKDGYEFAIESSNPALEGSGYTISGTTMMADDEVLEFATQQVLSLWEKADGLTFTVTLKRVPQENLPNELYVMIAPTGITLNQNLKPGDNDPTLAFNPETMCYEGTITLGKRRFKFYTPTEDGYTVFGQNGTDGDGYLSFGRDLLPFEGEGGWGASNCWYLTSTFNNADQMAVKMVVDVINNAVTFYPVLPEAPAQLYIWGSTEGGFNPIVYSLFGEMKASASNPNLFEAEIDVPYVGKGSYTDPEGGAVLEFEGWAFQLGMSATQNNFGMLRAQEGKNVIDLSKAISFNTTLNGDTQIYSVSSGKMKISFDWETLELVVMSADTPASFSVTLEFEGNGLDITDVNDFVGVFDVDAEDGQLDIDANPYTYTFSSARAALVIGAYDEYEIAVECTNYDGDENNAPFYITGVGAMAEDEVLEYGTQYTLALFPAANGLNFKVTIGKRGSSTVETVETAEEGIVVFNLQGIKVLESDNAAAVNTLAPGLYIVNGKKVLVRK